MGRLRDPVAGRPWDQKMGHSRDVLQTCFLNSTHILNLL